jgi:hypothetical protein
MASGESAEGLHATASSGSFPSSPTRGHKSVPVIGSPSAPQRINERSMSVFSSNEASPRSQSVHIVLEGVRPFVPRGKRLERARASVVLARKAEALDVAHRLQYNDVKRQHAAAIEELDDVLYYCTSEELKSREKVPILFDLPVHSPPVPREVMASFGFYLTAENEELDRLYLERYYFTSRTIHLKWAFEMLKAALEDLCHDHQLKLLAECCAGSGSADHTPNQLTPDTRPLEELGGSPEHSALDRADPSADDPP